MKWRLWSVFTWKKTCLHSRTSNPIPVFKGSLSISVVSIPTRNREQNLKGSLVTYQTEYIVPRKSDTRSPLLLVFGNPATHSVASGMFFSYEGKKGKEKEHRIWKMLSAAKIISFPSAAETKSIDIVNMLRKKALYELSYCSPFRIGLAVFYSMPSPASNSPWSGVAGLYRLFGREAITKIGECEKRRIDGIIRKFVSPDGTVIAFQKDAYLAIKSPAPESPCYTLSETKQGHLVGKCESKSSIGLFCLPPTRLMMGNLSILRNFRDRVLAANV